MCSCVRVEHPSFPCWFMDVEGAEFPFPGLCGHVKPLGDDLFEDVKNLLNPSQAEHRIIHRSH